MALGQLPPWLNVGPSDYLRALQAGNQVGLERRRLSDEEAQQAERSQQFQTQLGESRLDRELRMELARRAQDVQQKRFDMQMSLRQQAQDLHNSQFGLALTRAEANNKLRQQALDESKSFHERETANQQRRLEDMEDATFFKEGNQKRPKKPQVKIVYQDPETGATVTTSGDADSPEVQKAMMQSAANKKPTPPEEYGFLDPRRWIGMHPHPALSTNPAPAAPTTTGGGRMIFRGKDASGKDIYRYEPGGETTAPGATTNTPPAAAPIYTPPPAAPQAPASKWLGPTVAPTAGNQLPVPGYQGLTYDPQGNIYSEGQKQQFIPGSDIQEAVNKGFSQRAVEENFKRMILNGDVPPALRTNVLQMPQ